MQSSVDVEAVGAGVVDERAESVEGGRGGGLGVAAAVAQDADQAAHLGEPLDAVLADDAEGLLRGVRVVEGERGRGVDGDRGEVVGDHVVQLACHAGAFGGDGLAAVHLGEQRGLFGAQPGGLGGVAVVADERSRWRRGRTPRCRCRRRSAAPPARATRPRKPSVPATVSRPVVTGMRRAAAGGPYRTAAYTRSVNIRIVARLPCVNRSATSATVPTSRATCGLVRRSSSQPAITDERDQYPSGRRRSARCPDVCQTERPQQEPAEQSADRDVHVEAVRAGAGAAMTPSNTECGDRRLIPGDGPRLHRRMQCRFVTGDDDRGGPRREPGRVTERSEP